ncbi:MAG TPA: hypothetical protein VFJ81_10145 [Gemmatimonadales bacterium]|nr:hypothetical protein [Gemmatimonadales bacterium]
MPFHCPRSTAVLTGLAALVACVPSASRQEPGPAGVLAAAESTFALARDARDRYDVAAASGHATGGLAQRANEQRSHLAEALGRVDSSSLAGEDARALGVMRLTLARDLAPIAAGAETAAAADASPVKCPPDPSGGLDSLRARIYACYGRAQSRLPVGGDTLDRLTIFALLGATDDSARRKQLFLGLRPVWRSMDGEGGPRSPYRRLIALTSVAQPGDSAAAAQARAAGVPPDSLEPWLLRVLAAWRDGTPDTLIEPWDWFYRNGRASRTLSPHIPLATLAALDHAVFGSLGADLRALRVHFDLEPREGKDPVAFTTFGARAPVIEPWIFATYRTGGLDNLNELLHETGHAVHLAAIRTRPAFRDWPDSDPFTEAVADVVALDVYEPAWQQRWLGDSVPLADGLRGRYGGIVLDMAWALFERHMLREPSADPNQVWTELTRDYLRIRPHPELSWWAMRGQLVDAPGYMMNYAVGALLIAAIRDRIVARHGPFATGDSSWYGWVAPRLYRFGLERRTRDVVEEFLGGRVNPAAILKDLGRR